MTSSGLSARNQRGLRGLWSWTFGSRWVLPVAILVAAFGLLILRGFIDQA